MKLDPIGLPPHRQTIPQVIERQYLIRAIGHVASIGGTARCGVLLVGDHPDAQAHHAIDRTHLSRIARRQIIVHGDNMHRHAGQGCRRSGQRGRDRLPFTRRHLRHTAIEQGPASEDLHVIVPLADRPLGYLTHQGKGPEYQFFAQAVAPELFSNVGHLLAQLFIAQGGQRTPLFVDRFHHLGPHGPVLA